VDEFGKRRPAGDRSRPAWRSALKSRDGDGISTAARASTLKSQSALGRPASSRTIDDRSRVRLSLLATATRILFGAARAAEAPGEIGALGLRLYSPFVTRLSSARDCRTDPAPVHAVQVVGCAETHHI
jgi:hypothetical protein